MDDDMQDSDGWLTRLYNLKGSDWVPITTGQLRLTNVPGKGYCILLVADEGITELPVSETKQLTEIHSERVEALQHKIRADCIDLPAANMANLEEIRDVIVSVEPDQKLQLSQILLRGFYIDDLFDLASQLESNAQLECMFEVFLAILTLNHPVLIEYILSTQWLPDVIFILSHDPKISRHRRVDHRAFLCEKAKFKEVIPLPGTEVIELIHHSFMLQYLRDTIVIGILDDMTLSALGTLILETNLKIFQVLQEEASFNSDLMKAIQGCNDVEQLRDMAMFLNQYFDLPKGIIDIRERHVFFARLAASGLFDALLALLAFPDETIQLTTVGLLLTTVASIPIMMREYIMSDEQKESEYNFAESLIESFHSAEGSGEMGQFAELWRHLLDPCSMEEVHAGASEALEGQAGESEGHFDDEDKEGEDDPREDRSETFVWEGKEQFMRLFYQKFMPQILAPITDTDKDAGGSHLVWCLRSEIADLLTYCLNRHGQRIKSFVLSHQVLEKLMRLLPTAPGTLALAVIRFFRCAVGMSDRYLDLRIVHKNLFDPVMAIFRANMHRYNMINSAVLDLFKYVSEEEYRNHALVKHLVDKYRTDFEAASYAPCFEALVAKHEEYQDSIENGSRRTSAGQKRPHSDAFPDDADEYFDMLSDGEQSTPPLDGGDDYDDEVDLEEAVPLPSLKRRRKEEEEEEEDDPFSGAAQPTRAEAKKAPAAKGGAITFSWGAAKDTKRNGGACATAAEEAPSASEDSADEEPAEAPSPLATGSL